MDNKKGGAAAPRTRLAVDNNRVYAAGHTGDVEAFDLKNGRRAWRVNLKAPLAAAPPPRATWC